MNKEQHAIITSKAVKTLQIERQTVKAADGSKAKQERRESKEENQHGGQVRQRVTGLCVVHMVHGGYTVPLLWVRWLGLRREYARVIVLGVVRQLVCPVEDRRKSFGQTREEVLGYNAVHRMAHYRYIRPSPHFLVVVIVGLVQMK